MANGDKLHHFFIRYRVACTIYRVVKEETQGLLLEVNHES
jgi:hypothetical protein